MRASRLGRWDYHFGLMGQVSAFHWVRHYCRLCLQRTAKVWKDFKLLHDLVGHQQSVWTVLAIDGSQYLTGASRLISLRA